jgi:hypothetical protein
VTILSVEITNAQHSAGIVLDVNKRELAGGVDHQRVSSAIRIWDG